MMKMIHKLLFLPTIIFLSASIQLKAQSTENGNLFPNGGFEEWENKSPVGWNISGSLFPEQVKDRRPGGTGTYGLKIYLNDDNFYLGKPSPVKSGKEYIFSFWYKGSIDYNRVTATLVWYNNEKKTGQKRVLVATTDKDEWKKAKAVVTIPEGVNNIGLRVKIQAAKVGNIIFDDFSMTPKDNGDEPDPAPALEGPKNLKIKPYQREMEISWDKVTNNEVKWEVTFDGKVETTTSENSYVKTKLKPGSEHHVKVRAIKGKEFSPHAEQKAVTEKMKKEENSEDRIPYLRTISPDGNYNGRYLPLYYNELANLDARITYKLNGKPIQPKNDTLEFPPFDGAFKQFLLEVHIDEGGGCEWEIEYNDLVIRNIKN